MTKQSSEKLFFLLKLGFGILLVYWLYKQGKLDVTMIARSFSHPLHLLVALGLITIQILIGSLRWKILLDIKNHAMGFKQVALFHWIGQFFSSLLPGIVTGDLIKVGYVRKREPGLSRRYLLFTVFLDRLLGLSSLFFVAGLTSLIFFTDLRDLGHELQKVMVINVLLFFASMGFLLIFFIKVEWQEKILNHVPNQRLRELIKNIWQISENRKSVCKIFFLSVISHLTIICAFWAINAPFFSSDVDIKRLFTIIPLGQVVVAIPISPSGFGVGHMAYDRLFQYAGIAHGASYFNLFWIVMTLANLLGFLPFMFLRMNAGIQKSAW